MYKFFKGFKRSKTSAKKRPEGGESAAPSPDKSIPGVVEQLAVSTGPTKVHKGHIGRQVVVPRKSEEKTVEGKNHGDL